ncbi:MAG: protein kinase [Planctomycetes bacterium]|nr:protein kinase [Planctomycetota bacterium]
MDVSSSPAFLGLCAPCGRVWRAPSGATATAPSCPACGGPLQEVRNAGPILAVGDVPQPGVPGGDRPFGPYRLRRELGRGAMGVVYEAWDPRLSRLVAIKMLHAAGREMDAEAVERLVREARSCARLRHPAIAAVHDAGEIGGRHYFCMELVEGRSLEERLTAPNAREEFPRRRRVEVLARIAEALEYAHGEGLVHRDVKPQNILVVPGGRAVLMDFGLARERASSDSPTRTGVLIGTPAYMSPEQAAGRGREAGPESDVFSFGAVLYRALTDTLPFPGLGLEPLRHILESEPVALRTHDPEITEDLETVCLKCLEKKPSHRYPHGAALAADLRRLLAGHALAAAPSSRFRRLWRSLTRTQARESAAETELARVEAERQTLEDRERANAAGFKKLEQARPALDLAARTHYDPAASPAAIRRRADQARRHIEEALAVAPALAPARLLLGRAWEMLGDDAQAEACWREAILLDPQLGAAHFHVGRLLLERAWLASLCSGEQERKRRRGECERRAGEAVAELERAIALGSGFEDALQRKAADALVASFRGDRAETERLCREGLAAFPAAEGREEFHWILGRGQPAAAEEAACDAALEIRPWFAPARFARGTARFKLGRHAGALEDFDAAVELKPSFAAAHTNRGVVRGLLGDSRGAREDYDAAVRLDPSGPSAWNNRGKIRAEAGELAEALADFERAIESDPDLELARFNRVAALMMMNRNEDAIAGLEEVLRRWPGQLLARRMLATVFCRCLRWEEARSLWERILAEGSNDPGDLCGYGTALLRLGRRAEALASLEAGLATAPADWFFRGEAEATLREARG